MAAIVTELNVDDIECQPWLDEVGLGHYASTFLANFAANVDDGMLSRKRLSRVRMMDFPAMNITSYEHQKILMEHIRVSLQYVFSSPVRKKKVEMTNLNRIMNSENEVNSLKRPPRPLSSKIPIERRRPTKDRKESNDKTQETDWERDKRSFDNRVWESISRLRSTTQKDNVENLRNGKIENVVDNSNPIIRRRRWSYGNDSDNKSQSSSKINRATLYGNLALQFDMVQKDIQGLQLEYITHFKELIGCEVGNILFINEVTRELLFNFSSIWYRVPMNCSVEGYCAITGEAIHVSNPDMDIRFNRSIDDATGLKTRNVICHPLRMNRGGGKVVGVVRMLNKKSTAGFDEQDQELLGVCVQRISDELHIRFHDLLNLVEKFSSIAKLIISSKSIGSKAMRNINDPTKASLLQRRHSEDNKSMHELINRVNALDMTPAPPMTFGLATNILTSNMNGGGAGGIASHQAGDSYDTLAKKQQRRRSYSSEVRKLVKDGRKSFDLNVKDEIEMPL